MKFRSKTMQVNAYYYFCFEKLTLNFETYLKGKQTLIEMKKFNDVNSSTNSEHSDLVQLAWSQN